MKHPDPAAPSSFQRLNNVIKRVILGTVMSSGFLFIILMGHITLILLVFVLQVLSFKEILHIGYNANKVPSSVPYFRFLCWYFLVAANYFLSGEMIVPHYHLFYKQYYFLTVMMTYHRFISFCIYFVGIVIFVVSLVKKHDSKQYRILAWTHTLLIVVVLQSHMIISNIYCGLIWMILPVTLVNVNDIFAFVCGRLWGKTPLIALSPKKTWEGFIGAMVATFVTGYVLSNWMCRYKYMVCPIEYYETDEGIKLNEDCNVSYLFQPIPVTISQFFSFNVFLFDWHFISFTIFSSIFAPFGGFCASGFKRAFKVKDFGDVIPGHGGITDRLDCQFLMSTFVNAYIFTFVRNPSVELIFEKVLYLDDADQVQFYNILRDSLLASNATVSS